MKLIHRQMDRLCLSLDRLSLIAIGIDCEQEQDWYLWDVNMT